jgi:RimJ/RimL family protein N-acetyltransferase
LQSLTPVLVLRACQATRAYGLDILRGHSGALAQASVCLRRRATTCVYDRCVAEFVPPDFEVPCGLQTSEFLLEPLGPEHNEQDYAAWTSSMQHIAGTPGYPDGSWPREMTSDQNRADLQRHADDFRKRTGFTYTVLDPASRDVIGCVYIYPVRDPDYDACALSWVRESHAHRDTPLWRAVSEWLDSNWPFGTVEYAARA